ncbi:MULTISPECIES: hypothetical protein [Acinetobacter]|uniref:Uncharacterized protein n=1 Tax=Acinetobacter indicus TaxID=756892 RepID=A0A6C0Y7W0_9GAMM|nr:MULTISPECIES: hypothetical protein [Acinetobacter]QIC72163.1 hypothetical protein FSC09_17540 [Acinetobacter indicus]QKQ71584.1 hypothetical protein E5Y90_15230 [Acinetobacter sp. 10FS3-1]
MKSNHQVFQHLPLLNFQLITEKNENGNPIATKLTIFVDSDEDDLNRNLTDISLDHPHVYDFSLKFEGFQSFLGGSENEKLISGKVILVAKVNELSERLDIAERMSVQDKLIELAAPKLRVLPVKAATSKHPAIWASPEDIARQIKSNWLDVFSSALSGYLVQSYNLFNAKSIAEAIEANNEQTALFHTSTNTNAKTNSGDSQESSLFGNLNSKQRKLAYSISGFTAVFLFVIAATLVKSVFFPGNSINQAQLANNNFQVPTNVMSLEEAKKAQLRELGINPDDLAADLGCFVEEN